MLENTPTTQWTRQEALARGSVSIGTTRTRRRLRNGQDGGGRRDVLAHIGIKTGSFPLEGGPIERSGPLSVHSLTGQSRDRPTGSAHLHHRRAPVSPATARRVSRTTTYAPRHPFRIKGLVSLLPELAPDSLSDQLRDYGPRIAPPRGPVGSMGSKIRQAWSMCPRSRRESASKSSFAGFRFPPM
jgi:hypothetical protein